MTYYASKTYFCMLLKLLRIKNLLVNAMENDNYFL